MASKLTRLTHKIAIQLHLVAESCTISSSRSRRPVQELLDTPSYGSKFKGAPKYRQHGDLGGPQTRSGRGDEDWRQNSKGKAKVVPVLKVFNYE
jgi:hypothetical protein